MKITLPSGLTVILEEHHLTPVVAFQAWVRVGSADETKGLEGIAHVFEHMLFKGTARRGVGQIAQEVEGAGGDINAWTSFDQTVYHLVMASRYFDTGLDILADAIQHSSFDAGELERELKVVMEEIKQGEDNPSRVATQAVFGTAYTHHPYRRPVIGFERTVKNLTRARLLDFFGRWYVPNNMTLVVVGDFDTATALKKVKKAFGGGEPRVIPRIEHREPPQRSPRATAICQDVREAHLSLAFHIPGIRHAHTGALDVLSVIMGQGDSSRLNLEVRRNRQLATDVYAYAYTPRDRGLLMVGATTTPASLEECTHAVADEIFRLVYDDVTAQEVAKAKTILLSDAVYQKETVQGVARKFGFFETVAGDLAYEEAYIHQIQEVTPQQVREVAARYVRPANATTGLLVPEPNPKRARALSEKWQKRVLELPGKADARMSKRMRKGRVAANEDVAESVLPCGLRLLIKRDSTVPIVALRGVWMGGLRYEDEGTSGINNMLASLLVRGTQMRSALDIIHEVEGMAGAIGGFSGRNSFGLRAEFLSENWERALEIFADCALHPSFEEAEIEKERKEVLDELHAQEDNLTSVAFRAFSQTLYRKHPYRLDVLGTRESVTAMTRQRLADYYQRKFAPGGMTLALVGDVNPARVAARAGELFAGAAGPLEEPPKLPIESGPTRPELVTRHLNRQQAHIVMGFLGSTVSSPERYPLEVLTTILSGQGGRLFVELRDKQGLAYRISAFSLEGVDPGYIAVYMATSPENLDVAMKGIETELAKVREKRVTAQELERAQRYLVGTHEISLQRRAALASTLAFHECYGQGYHEYRRYAPSILAVTAKDVQRAAERFLDPGHRVLAIVKPEVAVPARAGRAAARYQP